MRTILTLAALTMPTALSAHPHVFIDTGVEIIVDAQSRVTHVRVTWAYDDFYSLLLAEDLGLDRDGDGTLTEAEEAKLSGFDANWVEGYNGDLELTLEDQVLALSGPLEPTSRMVEGRIVSTHLREVAGEPSISGDTLIVKAYDPTFYTDYQITLPVKITGNSACSFEKYVPDIEGELAKMRAFLLTLDADADLEENDIPLMGERFATEIRVTCPSS